MSQMVFNLNWEVTLIKVRIFHMIEWVFDTNWEVTLAKVKNFN